MINTRSSPQNRNGFQYLLAFVLVANVVLAEEEDEDEEDDDDDDIEAEAGYVRRVLLIISSTSCLLEKKIGSRVPESVKTAG